jgi:hypothetical protein
MSQFLSVRPHLLHGSTGVLEKGSIRAPVHQGTRAPKYQSTTSPCRPANPHPQHRKSHPSVSKQAAIIGDMSHRENHRQYRNNHRTAARHGESMSQATYVGGSKHTAIVRWPKTTWPARPNHQDSIRSSIHENGPDHFHTGEGRLRFVSAMLGFHWMSEGQAGFDPRHSRQKVEIASPRVGVGQMAARVASGSSLAACWRVQ